MALHNHTLQSPHFSFLSFHLHLSSTLSLTPGSCPCPPGVVSWSYEPPCPRPYTHIQTHNLSPAWLAERVRNRIILSSKLLGGNIPGMPGIFPLGTIKHHEFVFLSLWFRGIIDNVSFCKCLALTVFSENIHRLLPTHKHVLEAEQFCMLLTH